MNPRQLLLGSFQAALAAADAHAAVAAALPAPPSGGRTLVVGAGKAAAAMAQAVEQHWPPEAPLSGLVVTRYGHGAPTQRIEVVEAGHPLPDEAGLSAAAALLRQVRALGGNDLLIVLVSGGGSALLALPAEGVALADMQAVTGEQLRCGADIRDINIVRKHLSAILGGRLAAASRAPVCALIVSDVVGNRPADIASGPCAGDPSTYADAIAVIGRHGIAVPSGVVRHLQRGLRGDIGETPKPGDALFAQVDNRVIVTPRSALEAAAAHCRSQGVPAAVLGDNVCSEARSVAANQAALVRQVLREGQPWRAPVALISGGECTVAVKGRGRGGRCSEFLLALARELDGEPDVWGLACDTDGIDGSNDNAGALITPDSLERARRLGLDAAALAADNDAWRFFSGLGDLVVTGPTLTNVNDYRVVLVGCRPESGRKSRS